MTTDLIHTCLLEDTCHCHDTTESWVESGRCPDCGGPIGDCQGSEETPYRSGGFAEDYAAAWRQKMELDRR